VLSDEVRVSLFGSRALDDRKGGNIDLLFETDAQLDNRAKVISQLTDQDPKVLPEVSKTCSILCQARQDNYLISVC